jgi:hypothetical protein
VPASLPLGPGILAVLVLALLALAVLEVAEPTTAHQERIRGTTNHHGKETRPRWVKEGRYLADGIGNTTLEPESPCLPRTQP